jgi:two-component system, chemotaxis family, chemotaxis protein CheY
MGLKVIVVDDSPVTRTMLSDFLSMTGNQVVAEASDLTQTLQARQTHAPDLITLDLSMEKEDGLTVLKAIRQVDAKVKVLIVSANTQQDIYDLLLKEGATGVLTKPFTIADLNAALEKAAAK